MSPPKDEMDPLLTTQQLSTMFSVRGFTVRQWINDGKFGETAKINGRHRVRKSQAEAFAQTLYGENS